MEPRLAAGTWLARVAPEVVATAGLKPCNASQLPFGVPTSGVPTPYAYLMWQTPRRLRRSAGPEAARGKRQELAGTRCTRTSAVWLASLTDRSTARRPNQRRPAVDPEQSLKVDLGLPYCRHRHAQRLAEARPPPTL